MLRIIYSDWLYGVHIKTSRVSILGTYMTYIYAYNLMNIEI